jgi:hypothetical protein
MWQYYVTVQVSQIIMIILLSYQSWIIMKISVLSHVWFHLRRRTGSTSPDTIYYSPEIIKISRCIIEGIPSLNVRGRNPILKLISTTFWPIFEAYCYLSLRPIYPVLPGFAKICQINTRYMSDPTFSLSSEVSKSDVYHDDLSKDIFSSRKKFRPLPEISKTQKET